MVNGPDDVYVEREGQIGIGDGGLTRPGALGHARASERDYPPTGVTERVPRTQDSIWRTQVDDRDHGGRILHRY
jgi:hypothetical protein